MKTINYKNSDISIDINFSIEEDTIWMTQKDLSILFNKSLSTMSEQIIKTKHLLSENGSTIRKFRSVATNGKTYKMSYYNLEIIQLIGNKINPMFTNEFVSWCKEQLGKEKNQIMPIESNIIRFIDGDISLDVNVIPEENTVYLSQDQIALLFDTSVPNVSMHIKNIYDSCELDKKATLKNFLTVQNENGRDVTRDITQYNLDMIISLGYRINTIKGIAFRRWATTILKEYLLKGYIVDKERTLVTNDNYINLIHKVDSLDIRISALEKQKDINLPKSVIIDENHEYEAIDFLSKLVNSASKDIILIDPYADHQTLLVLSYKKEDASITLITSDKHRVNERLLEEFNNRYKNLTMYISNSFHDRYLILDKNIYYDLGTSVNYAGKKISIIKKDLDQEIKGFLDKKIATITNKENKHENN